MYLISSDTDTLTQPTEAKEQPPVTPTMRRIAMAVCKAFNITFTDLVGRGRTDQIAYPRHIFCYCTKLITKKTYDSIGLFLDRDHTTIIHSKQVAEDWLKNENANPKFIAYWMKFTDRTPVHLIPKNCYHSKIFSPRDGKRN